MNVTIQAGLPTRPPANVSLYGTSQGIGGLYVVQDANRVPQYLLYFDNPTAVSQTSGNNGDFYVWLVKINYHKAPYSPNPDLTYTQNNNLGYTAALMWNNHYTPAGNLTISPGPISYEDGVWTTFTKETMQWTGYSLDSGEQLWQTDSENAWDMYGDNAAVAYGNLYTTGYGGILYCYDIKTGTLKWTYTASNVGHESPYGDNYPLSIGAISDGKVFLYSTEHSPTKPLWRGSSIRAIDVNDGTELWKIQDFNMGMGIANGILISGNEYNNMIEAYGKGPSATTVAASPGMGNAMTIQGTVTDQSPGQTCLGVPAAGTPAIADQYMEQWMEYLYMQQAMPTNATGVPVTLFISDQNGNVVDTLQTTSDISGHYAVSWTPSSQGLYTVTAAFDGTNSYGPSTGVTSIAVGASSAQPSVTSTPTPTTQPPTQAPTTPTATPSPIIPPTGTSYTALYVAVAAVVIICVVAAVAVILRRRK